MRQTQSSSSWDSDCSDVNQPALVGDSGEGQESLASGLLAYLRRGGVGRIFSWDGAGRTEDLLKTGTTSFLLTRLPPPTDGHNQGPRDP